MARRPRTLAWVMNEVPDPSHVNLQQAIEGDVHSVLTAGTRSLLRWLASAPPGSASVTVRYVLSPDLGNTDPQSRLRVYLIVSARKSSQLRNAQALIDRGTLSQIFNLESVPSRAVPAPQLTACAHVIGYDDLTPRSTAARYDGDELPAYYVLRLLEPTARGDFASMDACFHSLNGPACLEVRAEPTDASDEQIRFARYCTQVQDDQRTRPSGCHTTTIEADYLGDLRDPNRPEFQQIEPAQEKDCLADDALRYRHEILQSLQSRQLLFHIRAQAVSPAAAHLVASVSAGSWFKNGSYRIVNASPAAPIVHAGTDDHASWRVRPASALPRFRGKQERAVYRRFERMSSLASVEELTSPFNLPIAGSTSPRCIRRSTDPKNSNDKSSILLGHDAKLLECGAHVRRGIPLTLLPKHVFAGGASGSGKTTFLIHLLLTLHERVSPSSYWSSPKRTFDRSSALKSIAILVSDGLPSRCASTHPVWKLAHRFV
jgi:hypothetical protein